MANLGSLWTTFANSIDRGLLGVDRLAVKIPGSRSEQLFWLLALFGTFPALRANSLLPYDWIEHLTHAESPSLLENPLGLYAFIPFIVTWMLARRHGTELFKLAVLPYPLLMLAMLSNDRYFHPLADGYFVSAVISLALFSVYARTSSLSFVAYVGFLLVWQSIDPFLSLWTIVLFVLGVLVIRAAVEAWRQNRVFIRSLGRQNKWRLIGKTLSLWWPMLFLIAAGIWLSEELSKRSENALYTAQLVVPICSIKDEADDTLLICPPDHQTLDNTQFFEYKNGKLTKERVCEYYPEIDLNVDPLRYPRSFSCPTSNVAYWSVNRLSLFENIDLDVAYGFQKQHAILDAKLAEVDEQVGSSRDTAQREARRLFTVVPRTTGMSRRTCYFPFLACEAGNLVIGELNRAYSRGRRKAESAFVNEMADRAKEGGDVAEAWVATARLNLTTALSDAEVRTRKAIARVHLASNFVQNLLLLWLVFAIIKSLLYVFSRVVFDQSTEVDLELAEIEEVPVQGRAEAVEEVDIPADYAHNMYYRANYQPLGPAPRFSIPQWRSASLARLRAGAWHMSQVRMPLRDDNRLTFSAIEAEHLIDWEMQDGEEVVFNYRNFVAMNENVKLRTVVSLRIASILLGRIIFHTARCEGGEGRLILRTRGKPATAKQVEQSIPSSRLVAWNRYAQFSVDSHLTPADIFMNGFNLRRSAADEEAPQGILIVEADARDGGVLVGTLRFAKNFLLPI